jgi:hypothetical protein
LGKSDPWWYVGCRAYVSVLSFIANVCMKQSMFGSSLPQLFVGELMFYACYFCLVVHSSVQHVLTIWIAWRWSYERQKMLTLRGNLGPCWSSPCCLCTQCCQFLWIVHSWLPLLLKKANWSSVQKTTPVPTYYLHDIVFVNMFL